MILTFHIQVPVGLEFEVVEVHFSAHVIYRFDIGYDYVTTANIHPHVLRSVCEPLILL